MCCLRIQYTADIDYMTSMLPEHTPVEITEGEWDGHVAFVLNVSGAETTRGETIPDGWCEVILDPMETDGYYTELHEEDKLQLLGC